MGKIKVQSSFAKQTRGIFNYIRTLRIYENYPRVLQNFTRRWALMISNDTQSTSEDSISQSY